MKTSTPTSPKEKEPLSILLLGPPGSGKTTLAMQFPDVHFIDCDRNLDGPERYVRTIKPSLTYTYDSIMVTDDNQEVKVEDRYDRLRAKLVEARTLPCQTVVIDTMTMVNEYIIRKVLKQQGQSAMRPMDYQPMKSFYWELLVSGIRSMGKTTIVTCHEIIMTEPDSKQIMKENIVGYKPSVTGGIADYFGGFFTDIWRCETSPTPRGTSYIIRTNKTTKSPDLKSSMGLPAELPANYEEIKKYL